MTRFGKLGYGGLAEMIPRLRMIHIGRKIPKKLYAEGWREEPKAIHLGRGIWFFMLRRLNAEERFAHVGQS